MDEFLAKHLERMYPDRRIVVTEADQHMLAIGQQLSGQSHADMIGPLGFTVVEEVEALPSALVPS